MASVQVQQVVCNVCKQDFSGAPQEDLMLHLLTEHPYELLMSRSVATKIIAGASRLGELLANKLRGETK